MPEESTFDLAAALAARGPYKPDAPVHVLTGEATSVAAFLVSFWEASTDGAGRPVPGLKSAGPRLSKSVAAEIEVIVKAANEAQTAFLLARFPNLNKPLIDRADFLEDEIERVLEWYFDDGVADENDLQLESVRGSSAMQSESMDAKALSLELLVGVARPHREQLHGLGQFDAGWLDEALDVAENLRGAAKGSGPLSPEAEAALDRRNGLLGLLADRVTLVRKAARFVFHHHPSIVRQATSAYERRLRAAARKAALEKQQSEQPAA